MQRSHYANPKYNTRITLVSRTQLSTHSYTLYFDMNQTDNKKMRQHYKDLQRQAFESSLPMARELFLDLFDYLNEQSETTGCNHDFSLTEQFLRDKQVNNVEEVLEFLRENGGYCDCEVIFNVEEKFEE